MDISLETFNFFIVDWQKFSSRLCNENQQQNKQIEVEIDTTDFISFVNKFNTIQKSYADNISNNILPKIKKFFHDWQGIPTPIIKPVKKQITAEEIYKTTNFFTAFSDSYQQYYANGYAVNVWDISGIKHDEVKHCQVLKWLLDPHESHGFGVAFFQFVVEHFNWHWFKPVDNTYHIKTEITYDTQLNIQSDNSDKSANNSSNSRVDIQIENDQCFVIMEVKINASETNDQIMRYCKIAKNYCEYNKIKNKTWKIIYLTKEGSKPTNCQEHDKPAFEQHLINDVIYIKWFDIANVINKFNASSAKISPLIQHLLHQYSQYIYRNF